MSDTYELAFHNPFIFKINITDSDDASGSFECTVDAGLDLPRGKHRHTVKSLWFDYHVFDSFLNGLRKSNKVTISSLDFTM